MHSVHSFRLSCMELSLVEDTEIDYTFHEYAVERLDAVGCCKKGKKSVNVNQLRMHF